METGGIKWKEDSKEREERIGGKVEKREVGKGERERLDVIHPSMKEKILHLPLLCSVDIVV